MPDYDSTNTIKIWGKREGGNPNGPDYRVEINYEGLELELPIWKRRPDQNQNGPVATGKIEKASDKQGYAQPQAAPAPSTDEPMPF